MTGVDRSSFILKAVDGFESNPGGSTGHQDSFLSKTFHQSTGG